MLYVFVYIYAGVLWYGISKSENYVQLNIGLNVLRMGVRSTWESSIEISVELLGSFGRAVRWAPQSLPCPCINAYTRVPGL